MQQYYLTNADLKNDPGRLTEERIRTSLEVLPRSGWLMDAACNDAFLFELRREQDYIGLELNLHALRVAQQHYAHHGNFNIVRASVEYLPIRRNSVKGVFAGEIFEHLENPTYFLIELQIVVESAMYDGTVVITTPVPNGQGKPGNPQHVKEWTIADLNALLNFVHFRLLDWEVCTVYGNRHTWLLCCQKDLE